MLRNRTLCCPPAVRLWHDEKHGGCRALTLSNMRDRMHYRISSRTCSPASPVALVSAEVLINLDNVTNPRYVRGQEVTAGLTRSDSRLNTRHKNARVLFRSCANIAVCKVLFCCLISSCGVRLDSWSITSCRTSLPSESLEEHDKRGPAPCAAVGDMWRSRQPYSTCDGHHYAYASSVVSPRTSVGRPLPRTRHVKRCKSRPGGPMRLVRRTE